MQIIIRVEAFLSVILPFAQGFNIIMANALGVTSDHQYEIDSISQALPFALKEQIAANATWVLMLALHLGTEDFTTDC